ncbi:MAG: porin family protein [Agriterribacter sp.]
MRNLSVFFIVVYCTLSATVFCQKTSFGITGGVSLANMRIKAESIAVSADSKIGFTAGIFVNVALSENFSFQPALNYVQKGAKSEIKDMNYESKLMLNYIELPLNFLYKPEMQKLRFFVGAGPSIAYALSGKEKEKDNGVNTTYTYKFGNNPDEHDLRALDFGANFLTGIETPGGFLIALNYNMGLSNLLPGGSSDDGTIKSNYFGFKVGYKLKGKK